jgi:hypothetical protein
MGRLLLLLPLTACGTTHVTPQPLPPLMATLPPTAAAGEQRIIPGEHMIWEVAANGMTIGRAEMITRDAEIESRFATDGFASMFADVHHDMTTPITPSGKPPQVYTLHSAIAWIRGWHPHGTAPAKLAIEYDGDRYLVVCEPPLPDEVHGTRALRVACQFDTREQVSLTLQLADDSDRAPLRALARIGSMHIEAELISRELRGSTATPVPQTHASVR